MTKLQFKHNWSKGNISVFVLVMGVVMSITIGGLAIFGSLQHSFGRRNEAYLKAISIAEAGVNYYRWHLAHDPEDYQDGTGEPGPYLHEYLDPQGDLIGQYQLEIIPPEEGSSVVTIRSTGWSIDFPTVRRTVTAKFGPQSLTTYSFLHNSNVWFGQGIFVSGEVFSNGGIRMDGDHDSILRSAKATYTCGTETGCWPVQQKPGVWGNGGIPGLWMFPSTNFDFGSIVTSFNTLKQTAQSTGVYLPPSGAFGYRLTFSSNGSVAVRKVTQATNKRAWNAEDVCENLYQTITQQQLIGTYNLNEKKLFYAEDHLFLDGVVSGKGMVVAARLPVESYNTDIFIRDNLTYDTQDGSTVLGVLAQDDVIFAYNIPQDFYVHGILMAQNGSVLRHHYNQPGCTQGDRSRSIRQNLTVYGSIISNKKSYWNFSGHGGVTSGFINRVIIFNQNAADDPPPFFPTTGEIRMLSWDEDAN